MFQAKKKVSNVKSPHYSPYYCISSAPRMIEDAGLTDNEDDRRFHTMKSSRRRDFFHMAKSTSR